MKPFVQYQIEVAICMAAFGLIYLLLWRKETNFNFKRILFLGIPLLSIIIPLININIDLNTEQESAPIQYITYLPNQLEMVYAPIIAETDTTSGWDIAFWVIALGVWLMFVRLLLSYVRILQIYRKSSPDPSGKFRIVDHPIHSFSFFNMIMINRSQAESNERQYIIEHELAHKRQGHSWDILWLEIIKMLHWFNPMIWFITSDSKKNLEYLADQEVAQITGNPQNYQFAIVQHASQSGYQLLKTQFSKTNLKNRIIMMNQPNNQKIKSWKILVILPVLAVLFMSFSLKIENLDISDKLIESLPRIESPIPTSEIFNPINKTKIHQNEIKDTNNLINSTKRRMQNPPFTGSTTIDERESHENEVDTKKGISGISNKNDALFQLKPFDNKAYTDNRLKTNTINKNLLSNSLKSQTKNVPYKLSLSASIKDENKISGVVKNQSGDAIPGANILIKGFTIGTITDVNGKFLLQFEPEHKQIVISKIGYEIKTLDIITGKDYEIILSRDPDAPPSSQKTYHEGSGISLRANDKNIFESDKKPLFILDGKEIENINIINPNDIESISVLKDTSAVKIYGEKAKDGVVIIHSAKDESFIRNKLGGQGENLLPAETEKSFDEDNPPLVIVDGKEVPYSELNSIDHTDISSIEVLKKPISTREYGEKAKYGVIKITMKKYRGSIEDDITLPKYPGGMDAFYKYISKSIKYPKEARDENIQGQVKVSFTVTKEGDIKDISADEMEYTMLEEMVVVGYRSNQDDETAINEDLSVLEDEIARVLKQLETFKPGTKDGQPVDVRMTLPVIFKLD